MVSADNDKTKTLDSASSTMVSGIPHSRSATTATRACAIQCRETLLISYYLIEIPAPPAPISSILPYMQTVKNDVAVRNNRRARSKYLTNPPFIKPSTALNSPANCPTTAGVFFLLYDTQRVLETDPSLTSPHPVPFNHSTIQLQLLK